MVVEREPPRIVFAGGGTGGHLYPAIAVAREVLALIPDARVTFAGTARGIEARVLPREGFELDVIRSAGLKGKSLAARFRGVAMLPLSGWDSWHIVSRRRPDVVVGTGGYSSGSVVLFAALRRVPTLVLEQNAVPGLTNRLLSHVVTKAAVTYEATLPYFGDRGFLAGNPVRRGFSPNRTGHRTDTARRLLVFGGSQGAHAINVAMMAAIDEIARALPDLHVTHQAGDADLEQVRTAYAKVNITARVDAFINDLDEEMSRADLIVCRAGATTLAEVTAAGRAAVLVPFPSATDDHQRKNAETLAAAGAAVMLLQRDLTSATLARTVTDLLNDAPARARMAEAARRFAKPDAARVVAEHVLRLAGADVTGGESRP